MTKILITGGAGFIGSNFIKYMINKYSEYEIINWDPATAAARPRNCPQACAFKAVPVVDRDILPSRRSLDAPPRRAVPENPQ